MQPIAAESDQVNCVMCSRLYMPEDRSVKMCYASTNSVHVAHFKTKNLPEARSDSQPVGKDFRQQADYFKGGKTHVFT
jgi:hypothetical protein